VYNDVVLTIHVDTAKYSDVHACHLHVPDMAQRNFGEVKPSRPEGLYILYYQHTFTVHAKFVKF